MAQSIFEILAKELSLKVDQVERTVALMDEGNTIPFISRYRKEVTGELDDTQLRKLEERLKYLRNLEERKTQVLATIEEQGQLTAELKKAIEAAATLVVVEDLYRPYRPKRRTRATMAKEKGLEPLALLYFEKGGVCADPEGEAAAYVDPEKPLPKFEYGDLVYYVVQSNFLIEYEILQKGALDNDEREIYLDEENEDEE